MQQSSAIVPDTHQADRPDPPPRSEIYREMLLEARHLSTIALLGQIDAFAATANDLDPDFPGEVGRFLARERLAACHAEIERRELVSRVRNGVASPRDRRYLTWRELGKVVRREVDITDVFDAAGYPIIRKSHLSKRESVEYGAACLLCGGTDRLVIWSRPRNRAWCRQCSFSGDVVQLAQSLIPGCAEWVDAVDFLARLTSVEVA